MLGNTFRLSHSLIYSPIFNESEDQLQRVHTENMPPCLPIYDGSLVPSSRYLPRCRSVVSLYQDETSLLVLLILIVVKYPHLKPLYLSNLIV